MQNRGLKHQSFHLFAICKKVILAFSNERFSFQPGHQIDLDQPRSPVDMFTTMLFYALLFFSSTVSCKVCSYILSKLAICCKVYSSRYQYSVLYDNVVTSLLFLL